MVPDYDHARATEARDRAFEAYRNAQRTVLLRLPPGQARAFTVAWSLDGVYREVHGDPKSLAEVLGVPVPLARRKLEQATAVVEADPDVAAALAVFNSIYWEPPECGSARLRRLFDDPDD